MHDQETHLSGRSSSLKCRYPQHMHRHNHGTMLRVSWMGPYLWCKMHTEWTMSICRYEKSPDPGQKKVWKAREDNRVPVKLTTVRIGSQIPYENWKAQPQYNLTTGPTDLSQLKGDYKTTIWWQMRADWPCWSMDNSIAPPAGGSRSH